MEPFPRPPSRVVARHRLRRRRPRCPDRLGTRAVRRRRCDPGVELQHLEAQVPRQGHRQDLRRALRGGERDDGSASGRGDAARPRRRSGEVRLRPEARGLHEVLSEVQGIHGEVPRRRGTRRDALYAEPIRRSTRRRRHRGRSGRPCSHDAHHRRPRRTADPVDGRHELPQPGGQRLPQVRLPRTHAPQGRGELHPSDPRQPGKP